MDKFKEFWENARERISNPFVFSFCVSWLFINWRIMISLFWYDVDQLEKGETKSLFDFISENIEKDAWWQALLFAGAYTIGMPPLRTAIWLFNLWISKHGDNKSLKILKEGKIPIERYFALRSDYLQRTKLLEELINQEAVIQEQVKGKEAEVKMLESKLLTQQQQTLDLDNVIRLSRDVSFLDGEWQLSFGSDFKGYERLEMNENQYQTISPGGERKLKHIIEDYYHDVKRKQIFFIKRRMTQGAGPRIIISRLEVKNANLLIGKEDDKDPVKYQRITSVGSVKIMEDEL